MRKMRQIQWKRMLSLFICFCFIPLLHVWAQTDEMIFIRDFTNTAEIPGGIDKNYMEGDYSWSRGSMYTGLGGKANSDYSLGICVDNYRGEKVTGKNDGKPYYIIHTPRVEKSVVAECSIYASALTADTYFGANINGIYRKLFELKEGGNIYLGGNYGGRWQENRWYHFGAEIDFDTSLANFYINGTKVLHQAPIRELSGAKISYLHWLIAACYAESYASATTPVNQVSAFDDIKLYTGSYQVVPNKLPEYIELPENPAVGEILSRFPCENPVIYTDNSLREKCEAYVDNGAVLTYSSEADGSLFYSTFYTIDIHTSYEINDGTIDVPQNTTVEIFRKNLTTDDNSVYMLIDNIGKEITENDIVNNGCKLIVRNSTGYQKQYTVRTAETESEDELQSSFCRIDGTKMTISQIPGNLNANVFLSCISKENQGHKLILTERDKKTPVFNKSVDSSMFLKDIYGKTERYYAICVGLSSNFYENWESEKTGVFSGNSIFFIKNDSHADVRVAEQDKNKTLVFKNSAQTNIMMQTARMDFSQGAVISFDCKFDKSQSGTLCLRLRDADSNVFSLAEVKPSDGEVKFFPAGQSVSVPVTEEGYHRITIKISGGGETECYFDSVSAGRFDAYTDLLESGTLFYSENTAVSFEIGDNNRSSIVSVDNIMIGAGNDEEVFCSSAKLYYQGKNGKLYEKDSVCDDVMQLETYVYNFSDTEQKVTLIAAVSNNSMKDILGSSCVAVGAKQTQKVSVSFEGERVSPQDVLNCYMWSMERLSPYAPKADFLKEKSENPSAGELADIFSEKEENVHPRVMASEEDFVRISHLVQNDVNMREWYNRTINSANAICEHLTNDEQEADSPYYIGYTTKLNEGLQILEISRRVKNFTIDLSMAYRLTKNTKYSDCVWRIIQYVGKQNTEMSSWGFKDWNPASFLDTAEMAGGVALGYDWCYHAFDEKQRTYVQETLKEYAIDIVNGDNPSYVWYKTDTANWNVVCNGGAIMAAISLCDIYPEECFTLIANAIDSLKYALSSANPDGAWQEGAMYAAYAAQYLSKASASLNTAFGTDFGIMDVGGVEQLADYFFYLDGPTGSNNYNDSASAHISDSFMFYLSRYFKLPQYTAYTLYAGKNLQTYGGALEMLWYNPDYSAMTFPVERHKYFAVNEVVSLGKDDANPDAAWLSFQGGFSENGHGHLDTGAFVYDCNHIRWACDLGAESYAVDGYFSDKRYDYYRARAEGHNTLLINPNTSGGQNPNAYTSVIERNFDADKAYAVLDMTECYSSEADKVLRGFKLLENNKGIVIRDEINLKKPSSVYWFMHTQTNVSVLDDHTVLLEKDGVKKKLVLSCDHDFEVSVVDALPLNKIDSSFVCDNYPNPSGQSSNSGYRKIMIKLNASGSVNLEAALVDEVEDAKLNLPLHQWGR